MSLLRVLRRRPIHCRVFLTSRHVSSAARSTTSGAEVNSFSNSSSSPTIPLSSCLTDTKLEGANFLKGQAPILALPDDQYPDWLWTILQPKIYTDDQPGGEAQRAKRRAENKQRIRDRNFMSTQ